jgi:hypothetical protein
MSAEVAIVAGAGGALGHATATSSPPTHGIRVHAVARQLLDTPTNRAAFPAEVMTHAVAPEAIAGVIAFLVGDAALIGRSYPQTNAAIDRLASAGQQEATARAGAAAARAVARSKP